jgi:hypothetical protein
MRPRFGGYTISLSHRTEKPRREHKYIFVIEPERKKDTAAAAFAHTYSARPGLLGGS